MAVELKNVVELSAEITQITQLKKHSVYKRLEKMYGDSYEVRYGIVLDVLSNGEDTVVETFEYSKNYRSVTGEEKTFDGSSELKIFPADLRDVKIHFDGLIETAKEEVKSKKDQLRKSEDKLDMVRELAESMSSWNEGTVVAGESEKKEIVSGEVKEEEENE